MVASTVCSAMGLMGTNPSVDVVIEDTEAFDAVEVDMARANEEDRDFFLAVRMLY